MTYIPKNGYSIYLTLQTLTASQKLILLILRLMTYLITVLQNSHLFRLSDANLVYVTYYQNHRDHMVAF